MEKEDMTVPFSSQKLMVTVLLVVILYLCTRFMYFTPYCNIYNSKYNFFVVTDQSI